MISTKSMVYLRRSLHSDIFDGEGREEIRINTSRIHTVLKEELTVIKEQLNLMEAFLEQYSNFLVEEENTEHLEKSISSFKHTNLKVIEHLIHFNTLCYKTVDKLKAELENEQKQEGLQEKIEYKMGVTNV